MPSAGLIVRHARLIGGRLADRERLVAIFDRVSLPALGLPSRTTLVLDKVVAPMPLALDRSLEGIVRQLEESLRRRAANARRTRKASRDGDWLFESEEDLEIALVAAWLNGNSPALLRTVTGSSMPDLRLRWRRTILTDGERAARTVARLTETGLAPGWLAGFDDGELIAAGERICPGHRAAAGDRPHSERSARATAAPALASSRATTAQHGLARTIATLAPEACSLPASFAARILTQTALIARRRPALLSHPDFFAGAQLALAGFPAAYAPADTSGDQGGGRPLMPPKPALVSPRSCAGHQGPQPRLDEGLDQTGEVRPTTQRLSETGLGEPEAITGTGATCSSQFAGITFLLNAFVALGLWGDFTRPRDLVPGLSPFELLLLLGRHWYGSRFVTDPLHDLLRDLAGLRPGEPPGRHFAAPRWTVRDDWLVWQAAGSHSRRRPCAGFPLGDDRYGDRTPGSRRRYWVSALAGYLTARLAAAIGSDDRAAACDLVCCRSGQIVLEPDALRVRFPLADHPLEIRIAGLDRDPGRLAGVDRSISFEFTA
jgi:hypothetical protein